MTGDDVATIEMKLTVCPGVGAIVNVEAGTIVGISTDVGTVAGSEDNTITFITALGVGADIEEAVASTGNTAPILGVDAGVGAVIGDVVADNWKQL